jgi:hypothetical protein
VKLLLFAGAGTSVELSIPAMRGMAIELHEHLTRTGSAGRLIESLSARLVDEQFDIENLIDDLDKLCAVNDALANFGEAQIPADVVSAAKEARAETEWFVQAACERLRAEDAEFMWTPVLRCTDAVELTIATTNYDRSIEIAAERLGIHVDDGFASFESAHWARWSGFADSGSARLLKIHGSTDWYRVVHNDDVVKLRHPMPLFGGASLNLDGASPGALGSALVLPSREKLKNLPPFPDLSHELYGAARTADAVVFVGSSLRDPDLRHLCRSTAESGIPTLVVGRSVSPEPGGSVPKTAHALRQSASMFLVSTLPRALRRGELTESGMQRLVDEENDRQESLIGPLRTLSSTLATAQDKALAIESLWRIRVDLDRSTIRDLMGDGLGPVAIDVLGLIPLSQDVAELVEDADLLAASSSDGNHSPDRLTCTS